MDNDDSYEDEDYVRIPFRERAANSARGTEKIEKILAFREIEKIENIENLLFMTFLIASGTALMVAYILLASM